MKKFLFLIITFLSIFFITDIVYADSLVNEAPSFSDRYYLNGTTLEGVYERNISITSINSFGWDIYPNVYNYFYYSGTGADIIQNMGIQWSSKDWCKQSEINFTGYLVPHSTMASTAFFYAVSDFNLYLETDTGSYLCSITREILDVSGGQVSSLKFSCNAPKSTSNTRNFKFLLNFNSYPSATGSYWGIQQSTFKYSCDIDTTDMINNQNQNTQNIINNQNQNSQNIINNQNQNQLQSNNKLDGINNSLNDETGVSQNDVSNKTNEWSSKLAGTGPVSNMVLMPITLLNGYLNGFNSTCSTFNLGNLMGTDIILPCINISNYLGATLWNVIDILFSGFMIYAIGKKFVKIFNDFTNLRDNQMDELYGGGK